jgi:hypothetical protein
MGPVSVVQVEAARALPVCTKVVVRASIWATGSAYWLLGFQLPHLSTSSPNTSSMGKVAMATGLVAQAM